MPRGVPIDGARQRMFAAAEGVVLRDGVAGLRGRAVTAEAGVATGLLHAHFGDFDRFLVAYVVDRSFALTAEASAALGPADRRPAAEAVCDALEALPRPAVTTLARLLAARPDLLAPAAESLGAESTGFAGVTRAVADRLAAETGRSEAGGPDSSASAEHLGYAVVATALRAWTEGGAADWRAVVAGLLEYSRHE